MDIVITGSVAYDYIMTFPGYFREHILPERLDSISLSFLVDSLVRRRGGTAPNIAYALALLGGRPRLFAAVGEDFEEYRLWLDSKGVDTSAMHTIPGESTASFFANTDIANSQIASFYPGAMAYAGELSLYELEDAKPDLVVISPNDPKAMNRYVVECQALGIPYLFDPSQQIPRLSSEELFCGLSRALAVFVNDYEFGMILKKTGLSTTGLLNQCEFTVVTCGEHGVKVYNRLGEYTIPVVPPERIIDPTGVGDAFRGGFLAGYSRAWDLETCGRMGVLAATYCLEYQGPQGYHFTRREFVYRYRQHFDDDGLLDTLAQETV